MPFSKRDLVEGGFEELGLGTHTYAIPAEQMQQALKRLDNMLAQWNSKGLRLGYSLPATPLDSDLDEDSGLPDAAYSAVIANLGLRLAPTIGKTASEETKKAAQDAYDDLLAWCAARSIPEMQMRVLPGGAGSRGRVFTTSPQESITDGANAIF